MEGKEETKTEIVEKGNLQKSKKKKNGFVKFLLGLLWVLIILIALPVLWLGINYFIKADRTDYVPENYSVHLRTDSLWDSVNPLLDLQALDVLLTDPDLAKFKPVLVEFRQSDLRTNSLVDFALSRRTDLMVYEDSAFVGILDSGILSGIVKLAPFVLDKIEIENLSVVKASGKTWFEYTSGENVFYVTVVKNLILFSQNKEFFEKAVSGGHREKLSESCKKTFEGKLSSPFAVTADSKKVLEMFAEENAYALSVKQCLSDEELAVIDFGISDKNLKISVSVPYSLENLDEKNPVAKLMKKNSKVPVIVQKLPSFVQYYTVLSAGSLEELKDAAFYCGDSSLNLSGKWRTAQNLSNAVFHENLGNLIFSWTDDEYAVIGLEQKTDPVFILKIKDEKRRREVFDTIFSSIILQNDSSLIMDNVRLPRIQLPPFMQSLLESFNIRLPSPYYMVKDGYLYLSQSPENLASINAALKNGSRIALNDNWKEISEDFSQYSALSLYYNLERSIPFFLKSKSSVSKILEIYNIGRFDLRVKDSSLEISLSAVECKTPEAMALPGFPVNLEGKINSELFRSNVKNSPVVFFVCDDQVVSYNLHSAENISRKIENLKFIVPVEEAGNKEKGALWVVTKEGTVYLFNEKLEDCDKFPLVTGMVPVSNGSSKGQKVFFTVKGQTLMEVYSDGNVSKIEVDSFDDISSTPLVYSAGNGKKDSEKIVLYERSFMGGIHVLSAESQTQNFYPLEAIGFGTPDVLLKEDGVMLGFVSQSGKLTFMDFSFAMPEEFSVNLDGVFYTNVRKCGSSFMALSEDGMLYRITKDQEVTKIKIPHLTARTAVISVSDFDKDGKDEVFVCGEGNVIYGFRENLEMIGCFPVAGYGKPVFLDLDGDKKNECIFLTLDKKLNGCKLIY